MLLLNLSGYAQRFVASQKTGNGFSIHPGSAAIYIDAADDWLVNKAATLLQTDMESVTGKKPSLLTSLSPAPKTAVIIGTVNGSSIIQKLVAQKKMDLAAIKGKWEAFQIQTLAHPFPGIDNALVIAGSDKRGAAYGVFELSKQMGVSPWWWWADVPAKKKPDIFIQRGAYTFNSPSVKYRGIFINDEAPAFSGWTKEKFGGVNHLVYEKMFELLLRLKGNYLWPAMWGNAFNDDDTLNPVLADKWGIVMGTSHHEPMLRAQQEWKRYGKGPWDYTKNDTVLRAFWKKGIQNMGRHESLVTVGMRGDGDMPMTQGTATELLERIVKDQRQIIEDVTGKPAAQTPQVWALYKEVQDYYDKGMRVPDDVTLLLADDNWGNIRKLPKLTDKPRSGGYGIYYHFDYVGGPRNYKWINTNNVARVWEQMHLAKAYGADQLWVVNVGDLKPVEFPISFFLDYAYDTKKWNEDNLRGYYTQWASDQFGSVYAKEIGEVLRKYSQYSARRKPELLDANTYSLTAYNEADNVLKQWTDLLTDAEKLNGRLSPEYKDAYFELVLHPVKAFTNLQQLYYAVARNKFYAAQKNILANQWADKAKQYYIADSLLSVQYNKELAAGKWSHMMDQTHIGYTYWQQPPVNKMPSVTYVSADSAKATNAVHILTDEKEPNTGGRRTATSFVEKDGYVSMLAAHYTKAVGTPGIAWKSIPDIGREGDGVTSFPVTAEEQSISPKSPHLEYDIYTTDTATVKLYAYFSPTLNFHNGDGLKYAVSVDDEQPQVIALNKEDNNVKTWGEWVANNAIVKTSQHNVTRPGRHTVKFWRVSPAVVLQKLVLDFGGLKPSYLGPPETISTSK